MRKKLLALILAIFACFTLIGCELGSIGIQGSSDNYSINSSMSNGIATSISGLNTSSIPSQSLDRQENLTLESNLNSVVEIYVITEEGNGAGSGTIISWQQTGENKGIALIVTCHHVIDSAYYVNIRDVHGGIYPAGLIGSNPNGDVAVLWAELDYTPSVARFGKSADLVLGEDVYAIGNPTGTLGGTVTKGIISATSREVMVEGFYKELTLLQIDSAINGGNSGGALFSADGYYVGMPNAGYSGKDGLGFAIPSDIVLESVNHLISTYSSTSFGYIPGMASAGLSLNNYMQVLSLTNEGSYKASGVQVGDIIVSATVFGEDYTPTTAAGFFEYLADKNLKAGDTYVLHILRDNQPMDITITIKQLVYVPPQVPNADEMVATLPDYLVGKEPFGSLQTFSLNSVDNTSLVRQTNQILEQNRNSSVEIYSTLVSGSGAGSGVIVRFTPFADKVGGIAYVVTNHHVIKNAYSINIKTIDAKVYSAGVIGSDSSEDVALLWAELDFTPSVATFANSDDISVGEEVYAIGNPLGTLGGTVTKGIISATSRELLMENNYMDLMQIDVAVNNGNSGGGLFTCDGYLVGIVNGGIPSQDGIGFAIASNKVLNAVNSFLQTYNGGVYNSFGYIEGKAFIGATISDGLSNWKSVVYISEIQHSGSFYKSGLRVNDIITRVVYNGTELTFNNASDLLQKISKSKISVGSSLVVTYQRDGNTYSLQVVLEQYMYVPPALSN